MPTFPFELVSPEKLLFTGEVEAVVVPGMEGEFTVLKDHSPVMSVLKPGIVEIDVSPNGLTILAEYAIPLSELDSARFDADVTAAEADVARAKDDESRRIATEKRDQLIELRGVLKL